MFTFTDKIAKPRGLCLTVWWFVAGGETLLFTWTEKVAIKSIRKDKIKDEQDLMHIRREIEIMSSLNHPHIIAIHEVFENSGRIVIVMEYASRGDLYDHISERQRLSEREARHFFRQIVSAVQYCHQNGVVHRDLKLENILLDANGNIKIADFGLSNLYHQGKFLQTFCGSPLYASPEIVNGKPYTGPAVHEGETRSARRSSCRRANRVAAVNLKDLKRLRLLMDFISRGSDSPGPRFGPQGL